MLHKSIPQSWQAGVALVIMLGALVLSFSELPAIVTGQSQASWPTFLGGLVVGLPATIYFYSRQNRDSNFRSAQQIELETLARISETQGKDKP